MPLDAPDRQDMRVRLLLVLLGLTVTIVSLYRWLT
jgi:hypothetical protein